MSRFHTVMAVTCMVLALAAIGVTRFPAEDARLGAMAVSGIAVSFLTALASFATRRLRILRSVALVATLGLLLVSPSPSASLDVPDWAVALLSLLFLYFLHRAEDSSAPVVHVPRAGGFRLPRWGLFVPLVFGAVVAVPRLLLPRLPARIAASFELGGVVGTLATGIGLLVLLLGIGWLRDGVFHSDAPQDATTDPSRDVAATAPAGPSSGGTG